MQNPTDRTGLFIIRAWIEAGSVQPLRAQIRLTTDVSAGLERTLTLSGAEEVCATVREWLADVICNGERPAEPPHSVRVPTG